MKTLDLIQGSPEWLAHRRTHFNASDAPAMMGCSPYKSRNHLLQEMHTGLTAEVDSGTQRRFDDGHRFEALARPLAEDIVGEDLYPCTGVEGKLSASFDGLTMSEEIAFEHKTLNEELRAYMSGAAIGGLLHPSVVLPLHYRVQMEQQLMVSGAEEVLFMATRWDGETLTEQRYCWYRSDQALRSAILQGWAQFAVDLEAFTPTAAVAAPVGRTPETLPSLHIVLKGEVSASNLAEFKDVALAAIHSVNRDLKTDQDFADSAKARKWCEDIEARVAAAKEHALGQTASIDLLFRTMDEVSAEARDVRLALEKLEKARKESRKGEIVAGGVAALRKHIDALNARLGNAYMPAPGVDFGAATRNLRTFDGMQNAVDTALANAKIAASATADRIEVNLKHLAAEAGEYGALFPDLATVVLKEPQDFVALVQFRVADHKAREQKRADALAEQARERIRQEEAARIQREQEEEKRRAAIVVTAPAAPPVAAPAVTAAAAPSVIAMPARQTPPASSHPTLSLGQIKERIAPLSITTEGLSTLGFVGLKERGSVLFHESDFPSMCAAMVAHIEAIQAKQAA